MRNDGDDPLPTGYDSTAQAAYARVLGRIGRLVRDDGGTVGLFRGRLVSAKGARREKDGSRTLASILSAARGDVAMIGRKSMKWLVMGLEMLEMSGALRGNPAAAQRLRVLDALVIRVAASAGIVSEQSFKTWTAKTWRGAFREAKRALRGWPCG